MALQDNRTPSYDSVNPSLGARLKEARSRLKISLTDMARRINYTKSHLSAVENDVAMPSRAVVEGYAHALQLSLAELLGTQNIEQTLSHLRGPSSLPRLHKEQLSEQREGTNSPRPRRTKRNSSQQLGETPEVYSQRNDWGEAPKVLHFYGREQDSEYLKHSMIPDKCHIIAIVGIGGVGKTTLVAKVARELQEEQEKFEYVFWRSLQHAPTIENILENCIIFLSDQKLTRLPKDENEQLLLLISYLRKKRCLLILDNFESVLQTGSSAGIYKNGYEGYGKLISLLGEAEHQSCLLITSREKPKEIANMEGKRNLVRSIGLSGLTTDQGQKILGEEDIYGSYEVWNQLISMYSGNPLALKLVSEPIRELFKGDIEAFLKQEELVVGDIHQLLEQQFKRLSKQEQEILYWLAIERETIHLDVLQQEVMHSLSKSALFELLNSLRRRFMIEMPEPAQFFMQPAIMEYVTNTFVRKVRHEICDGTIGLLNSHLLLKAQTKDYIREAQKQLILGPLVQRLNRSSGREGTEIQLKNMLLQLHTMPHSPGYAAGNILNLLIYLQANLSHADFSGLTVWQAYLQGLSLPDINFENADLSQSVFTETCGRILSVTISASGKYMAAGIANGEIRLWDCSSTTLLLTLVGHTDWVRSIAFSPDERTIVSGSDDQSVRLWDVELGVCLKTLPGHTGRIYSVAFHPSGDMIASSSEDKTIRLWDRKGTLLKTLQGHTSRVYSVCFSPDRKTLGSCSEDRSVRIWDINAGRSKVLNGHNARVWTIGFSPDGKLLASGGMDQTVRVWDLRTNRVVQERSEHSCTIYSVMFSPDGKTLASGGADHNIHLWETSNWQHTKLLRGHTDRVRSLAFHPAGNTLISGSDDQCVHIWDTGKDVCVRTLKGQSNWIYSVAFSPDGKTLASGGDDHTIHVWDVEGKYLHTFQGHKNRVRSVAFSPDGKTLASASEDQTVRLWSLDHAYPSRILAGHTEWLHCVTFSPDGKRVASGGEDHIVRIWDVETGQCLAVLQGHTDWVHSVAFHPNGEMLASASEDQTIRLWDTYTHSSLDVLRDHTNRIWSVYFSPDGKNLISGSDDQCIRIWDIEQSQEPLKILDSHSGRIWSVTYSPDGRYIANANEDQTIRIWDAANGVSLMTLHGHTSRVCSVAYSPDGQILASASHDGTILIWDKQGKLLRLLRKDRPYERMRVKGVHGVTDAQKVMLMGLGASED